MRQRTCDRGQATVEFALLLPFFALLVACTVGVTAACLDVLRMSDLARTAARLASVSSDPEATARAYVDGRARGVMVTVHTDQSTVTVVLRRRVGIRVPFAPALVVGLPVSVSSVTAAEPPGTARDPAN